METVRNVYRIFGGEALEIRPYERLRDGRMIWNLVTKDLI
jgi:hypothetical protein